MLPKPLAAAAAVAASLLCIFAAASPAASVTTSSAGDVRVVKGADSNFDAFTADSTYSPFINSHFWRMRVYSPYFDSRTSWYHRGWTYQNLYAIYNGSSLATDHPEWILKDANARKLYIPFDCSGGTCTQFAGDIGNPAFRAYWIARTKAIVAGGYQGVFIDDVNLNPTVSDGSGAHVMPQDPRTGTTMTDTDWRRYMAEFTEQIRAAMPNVEITHNAVWYAGPTDTRDRDPYVARELAAADYIDIERGINDAGLTASGCPWGLTCLLDYVDRLHSMGKGIILDAYSGTTSGRMYGLAGYFLLSTGKDALAENIGTTPNDWWHGYDTNLGEPTGPRYSWNGLLRRDFANGVVLLNLPGSATTTATLPDAYDVVDGARGTRTVTLAGASGAVMVRTTGSAPPAAAPAPSAAAPATVPAPAAAAPVAAPAPAPGPAPAAPDAVDQVPTVRLTSPAAGARLGTAVDIAARATDDRGVARVEFFLDARLVCTDRTAPYACRYRLPSTLKPGTHAISVRAIDTGGLGASDSVAVTKGAATAGARATMRVAALRAWTNAAGLHVRGAARARIAVVESTCSRRIPARASRTVRLDRGGRAQRRVDAGRVCAILAT